MEALHVWITGKVQGVYFRDSTRKAALKLGLTGWVRNLPDGRVEAVFLGARSACEEALAYVHKGPPAAEVRHVEHEWEAIGEVVSAFEIRF